MTLEGKRIVITGATGQVGGPIAAALAGDNEVIAAARFTDDDARARLEAAGVTCATVDLRSGDLAALPRDGVDAVLNFAVAKTQRWDVDLRITAESPGDLIAWCRPDRFLHCSTTGVYRPKGHDPITETDALGDNHAVMMPTYSIAKIAAETVVRFAARQWEVPTTIARLNVPYGDRGGWPLFHLLMMQQGMPIPVHTDAPSTYCPIHQDDITAMVPALLAAATLPVTTVNWAGRDAVSVEEWCAYIGELAGLTPTFAPTEATLESVVADTTRLDAIAGPATVGWREGFRRLVEANT